jgi:hypothetical protein
VSANDPEALAAQALADIEAKAEAHLASIRANAAAAKDRLEQGVLNLRTQAETTAPVEQHNVLSDEGWEFDLNTEASAKPEPLDATMTPIEEFKEEPLFDGIATDADGIPLPE